MEFGDGSRHVLGPGGLARVDASTVRLCATPATRRPCTSSWAARAATSAATAACRRARSSASGRSAAA